MSNASDLAAALGLSSEPQAQLSLADHDDTVRLGAALAAVLEAGDFVALVGTLGAGKTTLVQGLVHALDPSYEATSPTYSLVNVYEVEPPVIHMDLYRLENVDDLESTGYWDYVDAGDGIMCVEWLDRIPQAWPGTGVLLAIDPDHGGRRARMWCSPALQARLSRLTLA